MFNKLETISLIINVGLLVWAIYERILSQRDKDYIKASIRVWQNQAQGLASAIQSLSWASGTGFSTKFTSVQDVGVALSAVHDVAESMSQSLYETRFFTDKELKENIRKDKEKAEALIETSRNKKRTKSLAKKPEENIQ